MRSKKADLLNNVLTTIIAVIGLAIIFFAAWKLYSVYVSQDEKNAQTIANVIEARVNALGDYQTGNVVIRGLPDWFIGGWGKNDAPRPDACYLKSCICVCKGTVTAADVKDNTGAAARYCNAKGYCRFFDLDDASAEGGMEAYVPSTPGIYVVGKPDTQMSVIKFGKTSNLVEIVIKKWIDSGDGSKNVKLELSQ